MFMISTRMMITMMISTRMILMMMMMMTTLVAKQVLAKWRLERGENAPRWTSTWSWWWRWWWWWWLISMIDLIMIFSFRSLMIDKYDKYWVDDQLIDLIMIIGLMIIIAWILWWIRWLVVMIISEKGDTALGWKWIIVIVIMIKNADDYQCANKYADNADDKWWQLWQVGNLACKSGPREASAAAGRWSELQPRWS